MTIAVTGAAGHIGGNLVRALLERGAPVRALVHEDRQALAGLDVETVTADVRDGEALRRAFAGVDVVYHLAAKIALSAAEYADVDAVNVGGTANVIAACRAAGVRRLVHFSSIHALSPLPADQALDERRRLVAAGEAAAYDVSKAAAERLVLAAAADGLDAVVVNPSGVLGPYDFGPSAMGEILLDLHARRIPALVDGGFNWVDVRDVVARTIAAAERGRRGERYLLAGQWWSMRDFGGVFEEVTGVRAPRLVSPMWLARVGAPIVTAFGRVTGRRPLFTSAALRALREHRTVSHAKATAELGHRPRPLRDTLAATFGWLRETGRV